MNVYYYSTHKIVVHVYQAVNHHWEIGNVIAAVANYMNCYLLTNLLVLRIQVKIIFLMMLNL